MRPVEVQSGLQVVAPGSRLRQRGLRRPRLPPSYKDSSLFEEKSSSLRCPNLISRVYRRRPPPPPRNPPPPLPRMLDIPREPLARALDPLNPPLPPPNALRPPPDPDPPRDRSRLPTR